MLACSRQMWVVTEVPGNMLMTYDLKEHLGDPSKTKDIKGKRVGQVRVCSLEGHHLAMTFS